MKKWISNWIETEKYKMENKENTLAERWKNSRPKADSLKIFRALKLTNTLIYILGSF